MTYSIARGTCYSLLYRYMLNDSECDSRYTYFFDEYNSIAKLSFKLIYYLVPEVSKVQLEAHSATSATSAIAEVALRFNFLF